MSLLTEKEINQFTVGELKKYIAPLADDLPVNICVMKKVTDGVEDGFIYPVESIGTDGNEFSLAGYDL